MSLETILIIVLVVFLLGGGGGTTVGVNLDRLGPKDADASGSVPMIRSGRLESQGKTRVCDRKAF